MPKVDRFPFAGERVRAKLVNRITQAAEDFGECKLEAQRDDYWGILAITTWTKSSPGGRRYLISADRWELYTEPVQSSSSCVLTTACLRALGLGDQSPQLMAFRELRSYVSMQNDGADIIDDYYRTAPAVIVSVDSAAAAEEEWRIIYGELVEPVARLVNENQLREAQAAALQAYERIKRRHRVC